MIEEIYLKEQLKESFLIIDSCLKSYYENEPYMYKPLAGQLRILFCDSNRKKDNSLLPKVFPNIQLNALEDINWDENESSSVQIIQDSSNSSRIATMPFELMQYTNGLVIPNFIFANQKEMVDIPTWVEQYLTHHPTTLKVRDVIRDIADKGGGAHVDSNPSAKQRYMNKMTPFGCQYGEMFIIAMARLAQRMGEDIFDYKGFRPSVESNLEAYMSYKSVIMAHSDYSNAITTNLKK
jgi:hypothetical protein